MKQTPKTLGIVFVIFPECLYTEIMPRYPIREEQDHIRNKASRMDTMGAVREG